MNVRNLAYAVGILFGGVGALGCSSTCPKSSTSCSGVCTNVQSDNQNCGACGNACGSGQACVQGTCSTSCPGGGTLCGSICTNVQADNQNCGKCGTACPSGQACAAGACATSCLKGETLCGTLCINTQTDDQNCGACGTACAPGQGCVAGACSFGIAPAANGQEFVEPFDAIPTSTGTTIYFTAVAAGGPTVFRVPATGGTSFPIAPAGSFTAPVSIALSTNDATIFVADPGANTTADLGGVYTLPASGGTPSELSGTDGYAPRGLVIVQQAGADQLYFTGTDPANGKPGVFKIPAAGGTASVVAEGAPFADPSGVAVSSAGTVYVADTQSGPDGAAQIISVTGSTATVLVSGLRVGYPAGVALTKDESQLLVSAFNPSTRTDAVAHIQLSNNQVSLVSSAISAYVESAGLHRSSGADVYAWADSLANSSGTVFVISK